MSSSLLFSSIICAMLYHIDSTFTQLMPDIYSCDPFLWNASGSFSSCTQMLVLGIYLLGTKWSSGGGSVLSKGGTWRVWREKGYSVAVVGQVIVTDSCGHSCNGRRVRSWGAGCGSGLSLWVSMERAVGYCWLRKPAGNWIRWELRSSHTGSWQG